MSAWPEQTARRSADDTPLPAPRDAGATSAPEGPSERRPHSALVTAVLVAALLIGAMLTIVLGLLVLALGLDNSLTNNRSGTLGFLVLFTLLLLAAAEATAAATLTLVHRHKDPQSFPARLEYLRLGRSVAIAVGCIGVLVCLGEFVGVFTRSGALAQVLVFGLAAVGAIVWLVRRRHGRVTTLRTRSFVVLVVAMVVPCVVLSVLGVSAYYLSWDRAGTLYWDQAAWGSRTLNSDVRSLGDVPGGLNAAAEARLAKEIVRAFADDNRGGIAAVHHAHREGGPRAPPLGDPQPRAAWLRDRDDER